MLNSNDCDWYQRSVYWSERANRPHEKGVRRGRRSQPLVLCGHGASLRIDAGTLLVRNGFTHYPQKREEFRLFPGAPDLPERIILLDCSGTISFDVLDWISAQGIVLVRIDWRGNVVCAIGNIGYSANRYRAQWQVEMRSDPQKRMAWCNALISRKIEGSIKTLEKVIPRSPAWELAMKRAYADLSRLELDPPRDIQTLRTIEANSAAAYFRAWRPIRLRWKGTGSRPIPEAWLTMGARTSPFALAGNRNAGHPVNAILNYAYTVLQSEVHIQAVTEGFDPTIGIMHEQSPGATPFIFDAIEPYRSEVDRAVISLLRSETLHASDFVLRSDGVCRLNPQFAKVAVAHARKAIENARVGLSLAGLDLA
ncbi:CRISPR-associated endonuclease Cas1 [Phreatobacter aquaticus]|uniref:CRISPR-associated endonuclease Cas1 n=1 Tax=Phreatobacter aquaticus TaxID=2570229 RepID=UPI0021103860|nr:CRISPR-associated endonuclease Cas1 [Phreatobacter aquaticus]